MKRGLFLLLCLALAAVFAGLGAWQLQRLDWKRDLIARVNARMAAAPKPPPTPANWSSHDAYTRVIVHGAFRHGDETLVQAVTERGPGWWVMTPFRTDAGSIVLINRGFVPSELRRPGARVPGQLQGRVTVSGLLRASEPDGAFLRANAPEAGRWYSRDVVAIARARGLGPVAPYFIDAGGEPNPGGYPVGGLTVVAFRNSHLIYALTWFGLSVLSLAGAVVVFSRGGRD